MPRKIGIRMKDVLTKEILYDLYINQNLTTVSIAKQYNCSDGTVGKLLRGYGIPIKERRKLKNVLNKEELYDLYINKDMTTYEIGSLFGFDEVPVQRLLKEYGIPKKKQLSDIVTKDVLFDLYSLKKLRIEDIAEMYGCCKNSINNLIKRYELEKLDLSERLSEDELYDLYIEKNNSIVEIANLFRCRVNNIAELIDKYGMRKVIQLDQLRKELSKENLYELYITEDFSMSEIAELYNCNYKSVGNLLDEYDIPKHKEKLGDIITKEELEKLYITNNLTTFDIAEIYNCSPASIGHLLRKYNIETRAVNNYIGFGHIFESVVKEIFEVLKMGYEYKTNVFEGIIPDFYDKENDIILDAKLSSYTPFIRIKDGNDFFDRYKGYSDKVIIVYLRGNEFKPIHNFEWIHISNYYSELKEINREDLIEQINNLEKQIQGINQIIY